MGTARKDPLAGKSQALKAALAAVERMSGAAAHRPPKAADCPRKPRGGQAQVPDARRRVL